MPRPDQPPGNVAGLPFFSVLTPRLTDTLIGACVMWQRQRKADGLPHDAELSDFVTALAGARRGQAGTSLDERSTTGDSDDTRLLLTYREAAARLAISERHVKRLIKGGHLRRVHLGSAARVHHADLDAYATNLRQEAAACGPPRTPATTPPPACPPNSARPTSPG